MEGFLPGAMAVDEVEGVVVEEAATEGVAEAGEECSLGAVLVDLIEGDHEGGVGDESELFEVEGRDVLLLDLVGPVVHADSHDDLVEVALLCDDLAQGLSADGVEPGGDGVEVLFLLGV